MEWHFIASSNVLLIPYQLLSLLIPAKIIMINCYKKLLRLSTVKDMTGLSKSTIYTRIAEGTFPKQIPIGPRLVAWSEYEIENWITEQISAARG